MNGLISVGYFLVTTLFTMLTFILWLRLFIRYFRVGPFHPISQSVYKLTAIAVHPIHQYITKGLGTRTRYDVPCIVLLVICELLKILVIHSLFFHAKLPFGYLLLYVGIDLMIQPCNLLFYAVIIRTLMSWIHPDWYHPFSSLIFQITEPLLKPIRNTLPHFGMIDFSPLIAAIVLKSIALFAAGIVSFPF